MHDLFINTSTSQSSKGSWQNLKSQIIYQLSAKDRLSNKQNIGGTDINMQKQWKSKNRETEDMFKKYSQFMTKQNSNITKILLNKGDSQQKPKSQSIQEQIINNLREQSNSFIKQLLTELTECYSKLHHLKTSSSEQIQQLQTQLQHEKQVSKLLKQQLYSQMQEKAVQCQKYIVFMQKQLEDTTYKYQQKIVAFLQQIQRKDRKYDEAVNQKYQLIDKLSKVNRILRLEQQHLNEKTKQFKGMELLIQEYQNNISQYQSEINKKNTKIEQLNGEVAKLQQYNQDVLFELDRSQENNRKYQLQTKRLQISIQQVRQINSKYLKQIQSINQLNATNVAQFQKQIKQIQNRINKLKLQLQSKTQKLLENENSLKQINCCLYQVKEQLRLSKIGTKQTIIKIKKMHQTKYRLLKKFFLSKLKQLKNQNCELKAYVKRQIFGFYQQLKMDFILNSSELTKKFN